MAGIMHDIRLVDGVDPETTSEVGDHPLDTHQVPEVAGSVNWAGDEFYPGCFPEDGFGEACPPVFAKAWKRSQRRSESFVSVTLQAIFLKC
eukprot:6421555-Amphidinium_carterae.2